MNERLESRVKELFTRQKAVLTGDHFVYTSGRHGPDYVNKDAVYPDPFVLAELASFMAMHFVQNGIDFSVVVAPEKGAIQLSTWVAYYTRLFRRALGDDRVVHAVYAEKKERRVYLHEQGETGHVELEISWQPPVGGRHTKGSSKNSIEKGEELIIRGQDFEFKRGYSEFVIGKDVLIVEDILNTGGSGARTITAVEQSVNPGGRVAGVAVLCNRGGVTPEMLGLSGELQALLSIDMQTYAATEEEPCPLCTDGVPVNEQIGKGKAYMDAKCGAAAQ